jgi:heat shock protein HtpX
MNTSSPSLLGRALLAIVLMVGFYLLAFVLIALLLGFVYLELVTPGRIQVQLVASAGITALALGWAVLPRPDKFIAPGPELTAAQEPRLFREIQEVATATQQHMPKEVYLLAEPNAFVTHRGGVMGIGSKRVMGIGLPLMKGLTIPEMKAVLAHEFGHYHGGDTAVGPWIYKTRAAIMRSVGALDAGNIVRKPFEWYAKMFLRLTQAISRQQEFAADALAARTVGASHMIGGLQKVGGLGLAFDTYWQQEYAPILQSGARPPLANGFERYLKAEGIANAVSAFTAHHLSEGKTNPYDSHPATKDRIAALETVTTTNPTVTTDASAITLLVHVPALEKDLIDRMVQGKVQLNPIAWEEVGDKVWLASYTRRAQQFGPPLQGVTIATIPEFLKEPMVLNNLLRQQTGRMLTTEELRPIWVSILGAMAIVALVQAGWKLHVAPGEILTVSYEDRRWEPFKSIQALVQGNTTDEAWRESVTTLGIGDFKLA